MKKLLELISKCQASVNLSINNHKDCYQSVEEYLHDMEQLATSLDDDIRINMSAKDSVIEIQFYPDTPVGFIHIFHYDLGLAMDKALEYFKNRDHG